MPCRATKRTTNEPEIGVDKPIDSVDGDADNAAGADGADGAGIDAAVSGGGEAEELEQTEGKEAKEGEEGEDDDQLVLDESSAIALTCKVYRSDRKILD